MNPIHGTNGEPGLPPEYEFRIIYRTIIDETAKIDGEWVISQRNSKSPTTAYTNE